MADRPRELGDFKGVVDLRLNFKEEIIHLSTGAKWRMRRAVCLPKLSYLLCFDSRAG